MEIKALEYSFSEFLKSLSDPSLSLEGKRFLFLRTLDLADKALKEGRITSNGKVVTSLIQDKFSNKRRNNL